MKQFLSRLTRCGRDPRYRVMGPEPFLDFGQFRAALEAHYAVFNSSVHRSVPRDQHLFALACDAFFRHFYPRLEWPDWIAFILFFGTCQVILLTAAAQSHWGVIAPALVTGLVTGKLWRVIQHRRQWRADAKRFMQNRYLPTAIHRWCH
jgi:hypothetical protein